MRSGHVPNDKDRDNYKDSDKDKDYANDRHCTAPLGGAARRGSGEEWGGRGGGGDVFRVAYSLHSSFKQLESFLDFLRPVSVIGKVAPHHTR